MGNELSISGVPIEIHEICDQCKSWKEDWMLCEGSLCQKQCLGGQCWYVGVNLLQVVKFAKNVKKMNFQNH
jgi:hypothetical protein